MAKLPSAKEKKNIQVVERVSNSSVEQQERFNEGEGALRSSSVVGSYDRKLNTRTCLLCPRHQSHSKTNDRIRALSEFFLSILVVSQRHFFHLSYQHVAQQASRM
eukprot:scaffold22713_cov139-Cylindrotheca_fusiformis.AAC.1